MPHYIRGTIVSQRPVMTRRSLLLSASALLAAGGAFFAARPARANAYYAGPISDHFDGTIFFNPDGTPPGRFTDLLKWQLGGGRAAWPETWPSPFPSAKPEPRVDVGMIVTFAGHASLLYQTGGLNILTDPVWSQRMSPVSFAGPKRMVAPGIAFDDLPTIDVVLVTHNHYDHLDVATLARLVSRDNPLIITPLGNDAIIHDAVPGARVTVLDWGQAHGERGLTFHCEPCHHWSARSTRDRRHALWAAFVIEGSAGLAYHVGDTGFHRGINYRAAREKFGGFAVAALPVGAYEPRWFMAGQHQNPQEAVEGFQLLNAKLALGHHWGTVQLTNEAIDAPLIALTEALAAAGLAPGRFPALRPGQVVDVAAALAA
jgi:L-ascorbate metabolism protein UlaG (beta-lactamase superfamily)